MNFSIGYNFKDKNFVKCAFHKKITEIYFSFPGEPSGRIIHDKDVNTRFIFFKNLRRFKEANKKLNLILNGIYYPDNFLIGIKQHFKKILDILAKNNSYPDIITVAIPYFASVIREIDKNIEIRASVILEYESIQQLETTKTLFDSYYISSSIVRNINLLQPIKKWCDINNKKINILANQRCIYKCPYSIQHYIMIIKRQYNTNLEVCDTFLKNPCSHINDLLLTVIKGMWIRPEDTHYYDNICTTMKLQTRTQKTMTQIVDAYLDLVPVHNVQSQIFGRFDTNTLEYHIDLQKYPKNYFEMMKKCNRDCQNCNFCDYVYNLSITKNTNIIKQD